MPMSLEAQVGNIIWLALSVVALCVTIRYVVVPAMRDTLRYRLFSIRRDMFLFMANGGISQDHAAYGHVRAFLNASIRYADHFSLSRTIAGVLVAGDIGRERTREIEASMNALAPEVKTRLQSYRQRAALALAVYAVVRSPLAWILSVIAAPILLVATACSMAASAGAKPWARIRLSLTRRAEQETQILRCIEEEGAQPMAA
jgi:hypothetical protein